MTLIALISISYYKSRSLFCLFLEAEIISKLFELVSQNSHKKMLFCIAMPKLQFLQPSFMRNLCRIQYWWLKSHFQNYLFILL